MIKQIVFGIWVCLATLGGIFLSDFFMSGGSSKENSVHVGGLDYVQIDPLTVPILRNGAIEGYIVANFTYAARSQALKELKWPVAPYLMDRAFRAIYNDETIQFKETRKQDLDKLLKSIAADVNDSLGKDVLSEVLIEQLNYIPADQVRCTKKFPTL